MVKGIKYSIYIHSLGFCNSDFIRNNLEIVPRILVNAEFDDCTINGIEIVYTRNGFLVKLDSSKIQSDKADELQHFINYNEKFQNSFDEFIQHIKDCEFVGGC